MAGYSDIEWTESTWNPVTGCTKISAGCKNCYAERMAHRLKAMGQPNYANGFQVTMHQHALDIPFSWKKPRTVFVNSMSDLFHKDVPLDFIRRVFEVMRKTPWHTYQVLTKRSGRLHSLRNSLQWAPNIWAGVSVESDQHLDRMEHLREVPATVRFISFEPLLEPLPKLELADIHWAIVGGESGPGARPLDYDWVVGIRDQCVAAEVPFFFKQWGGPRKKQAGRKLDGRTWDELPETAQFNDQQELLF